MVLILCIVRENDELARNIPVFWKETYMKKPNIKETREMYHYENIILGIFIIFLLSQTEENTKWLKIKIKFSIND